jgi:hypothetical protein
VCRSGMFIHDDQCVTRAVTHWRRPLLRYKRGPFTLTEAGQSRPASSRAL